MIKKGFVRKRQTVEGKNKPLVPGEKKVGYSRSSCSAEGSWRSGGEEEEMERGDGENGIERKKNGRKMCLIFLLKRIQCSFLDKNVVSKNNVLIATVSTDIFSNKYT